MKLLSIVFSFKNEENNLPELISRTVKTCSEISNWDYELIFVNDNSTDKSEKILIELQNKYPITIINSVYHKGGDADFVSGSTCCDRIDIVYGDYDLHTTPKFKRYKVIYFAGKENEYFNLYKVKQIWDDAAERWNYVYGGVSGREINKNDAELLRKYLVEMEFVPIDEKGEKIATPLTVDDNSNRLTDIRTVDVKLTFRSKDDFYKKKKIRRAIEALKSNTRDVAHSDKYLRDSVVVSIHTRNVSN